LRHLWLVIFVLFHCRAPSPVQHALDIPFVPPPTDAVTSPGLTGASRDKTSLIVTQCLGLHPLYSHPTIPLSVHYALNLFFHAQKSAPFTLYPERTRGPVLIAFSHTLILDLVCSSGDVDFNPGPAAPNFCNRKSLGFMHVNIRSLLPEFVLFTALVHSANLDVQAVSESWLRKSTKNVKISIPIYNIFRQDSPTKGGRVAIYCRDSLQSSVILSKSVPKQFELLLRIIHLYRKKVSHRCRLI
jgi:hypothetical protein